MSAEIPLYECIFIYLIIPFCWVFNFFLIFWLSIISLQLPMDILHGFFFYEFFPVKFQKWELFINDTCIFKLPHGTCSHVCFLCSFRFIMSFDSLDSFNCAVREASETSLSSLTNGKTDSESSAQIKQPVSGKAWPLFQVLCFQFIFKHRCAADRAKIQF